MNLRDDERELYDATRFATTRWSLVMSAAQGSSPACGTALEQLCRAYWYPLYAYVRRRGYSRDDASDLTQEFFARLLENQLLGRVDPAEGKFRSYLLRALQHFLANEWDRATARRRGGGRRPISIDAAAAEGSYQLEPTHDFTAEKVFERRWALTLLEHALQRLSGQYVSSGKGKVFDALKPALVGSGEGASYREIGCELGMSEGAVKVAVHRLRKEYRRLLMDEIAQTVASRAEVDEELQALLAAVGD